MEELQCDYEQITINCNWALCDDIHDSSTITLKCNYDYVLCSAYMY